MKHVVITCLLIATSCIGVGLCQHRAVAAPDEGKSAGAPPASATVAGPSSVAPVASALAELPPPGSWKADLAGLALYGLMNPDDGTPPASPQGPRPDAPTALSRALGRTTATLIMEETARRPGLHVAGERPILKRSAPPVDGVPPRVLAEARLLADLLPDIRSQSLRTAILTATNAGADLARTEGGVRVDWPTLHKALQQALTPRDQCLQEFAAFMNEQRSSAAGPVAPRNWIQASGGLTSRGQRFDGLFPGNEPSSYVALQAAGSGRCGGIVQGRVPTGVVPIARLCWKEGAGGVLQLSALLISGERVPLCLADRDVVLAAIRHAADGRAPVVSILVDEDMEQAVSPAIDGLPVAVDLLRADTWVDTYRQTTKGAELQEHIVANVEEMIEFLTAYSAMTDLGYRVADGERAWLEELVVHRSTAGEALAQTYPKFFDPRVMKILSGVPSAKLYVFPRQWAGQAPKDLSLPVPLALSLERPYSLSDDLSSLREDTPALRFGVRWAFDAQLADLPASEPAWLGAADGLDLKLDEAVQGWASATHPTAYERVTDFVVVARIARSILSGHLGDGVAPHLDLIELHGELSRP